MKNRWKIKRADLIAPRSIWMTFLLFAAVAILSAAINRPAYEKVIDLGTFDRKDSIKSVKAFMDVYKVLMSPRCMNCHPKADMPLQGDDSHTHQMNPQRGTDGKGVYAMKCANCHQPENTAGLHAPPGNPNWHLPPADMKMVFEGRSPRELAIQLVDPSKNGHKNMQQLLEHSEDDLVKWGWSPGEGRTTPPLSHEAFSKAWRTWIENGAYAPAK